MKTRFVGVVAAFAAIVVVFAVVVLTIAAIQDYQENKGQSFIERAASIVGIGTLTEDVAQVTVEVDDEDVGDPEKRSSGPPDIFRFFGRSEDNEEWLDDLFERRQEDREYSFKFEDRMERLPADSLLPGWEFSGFVPPDWLEDLVKSGVMTQEDVDQLRSWLDDLPDSFGDGMPRFSDERNFEFESDDGRFRFKGRWGFGDSEDDSADEYEDDEDRYELLPNKGISF